MISRTSVKLEGNKFDKDSIKGQFKPIWKLWEALKKNFTSNELKKKYSDDDKSPVKSFIYLEKSLAIKLIQSIDDNLKSIHGFITGSMLLSEEIRKLASQLIQQQVEQDLV